MKLFEHRAPSFLKTQRAATRGEPVCLAMTALQKLDTSAGVVASVLKKRRKAAVEHSQRIAEECQAERLMQ
jgi:hypothetical protein